LEVLITKKRKIIKGISKNKAITGIIFSENIGPKGPGKYCKNSEKSIGTKKLLVSIIAVNLGPTRLMAIVCQYLTKIMLIDKVMIIKI
jgi:hypothetical protein